MEIITTGILLQTEGNNTIFNITDEVLQAIKDHGFTEGQVLISSVGSTTGISTLEYEPGLVNHDVAEMLNILAPYGKPYEHNKTWGDDNGSSHLRSFITGTSQSIPFKDQMLLLGNYTNIVFIDYDTRPRERKIIVQIMGKKE